MSLYARIAGSHLGSSALFGSLLGAFTLATGTAAEAATTASLAAASWFATVPLLKRLIGAVHGA